MIIVKPQHDPGSFILNEQIAACVITIYTVTDNYSGNSALRGNPLASAKRFP